MQIKKKKKICKEKYQICFEQLKKNDFWFIYNKKKIRFVVGYNIKKTF